MPAGSIVRMGPGRDYHDILDGPWDSLAFFVSRPLADCLRIAPSGSEFQALAPERNVRTLTKRQIAEFLSFANAVSDICSATDVVDETWAPAIRARALALLTAAQDFPRSGTRERIRVRQVHDRLFLRSATPLRPATRGALRSLRSTPPGILSHRKMPEA